MTIFFGMDLFFLLSGFLIGSILLHSLKTTGNLDLRRFYLRRIFRTFPAYWVVLAYLVLVTGMTLTQRENLPYEILYATNFLPLDRGGVIMFWGWSLALEEQFYLTVPALFYLLQRMKSERLRFSTLGPPLARAARHPYLEIHARAPLDRHRPLRGSLLSNRHALRRDRRGDLPRLSRTAVRQTDRTMAPDPPAPLDARPPGGRLSMDPSPARRFRCGEYSMGACVCLGDAHKHYRFLGARGFHTIATLGYGIYLVHIPLLYRVCVPLIKALKARGYSMWVGWPLAFVVDVAGSLAIGYVLHILVEKPSLWLRQKVAG
ncbi:hypothetical protein OUZ56_032515 [Daphnia magna]|uniref:Acyltransferase 3 domain-containing protein n=1 Tax=Daphnia magna TaxID=35525 RepID=A0ABR0B957_9CRUS|nr:hypothetical protein OUZ56_032515 [Daphnia magna]